MGDIIEEAKFILSYSVDRYNRGDIQEAMRSGEHALNIIEEKLPQHHPDLIDFYNTIGVVYQAVGEYERALEYQNKAFECMKGFLPPNHPKIAGYYLNIGLSYSSIEKYEESLKNFQCALEIVLKSSSPDLLMLSKIYANIGNVLISIKKPENALEMYDYALKLTKDSSIIDIPYAHIVQLLFSRGGALMSLKKYDDALEMFDKTLKTLKIIGQNPILVVAVYRNMCSLYRSLGQDGNALAVLEQELGICKEFFSENPRMLLEPYKDLAIWHYKKGLYDKAGEYAGALIEQIPLLFMSLMRIYDEELRKKQVESFLFLPSLIYTITYRHFSIPKEKIYNVLLYTKDIGKEVEFVAREAVSPERYPQHKETFEKLHDKRCRYQNLIINPSVNKDEIKSQLADIRELELILAQYVREIDFKLHMESLNPKEVLKNLPKGHALLEYSAFYYEEQSDKLGKGKILYLAFFLCDDKIETFYLNTEDIINNELHAARKNIIPNEQNDSRDASKELSTLYQLLITPVVNNFENIKHLYIAPDGELFKLPFELLLDDNNVLLSDKVTISYLSSGRDIARIRKWSKPFQNYNSAAILADPSYDLPDGAVRSPMSGNNERGAFSSQSRDIKKTKKCDRLPFAIAEANALERVFKGTKEKRYQLNAKKNTLNKLGSPDIIHIATHGFYLEKQKQSKEALFSVDRLDSRSNVEDPLLRCGLMFAGVNDWLDSNKQDPPEEYGDGILNAKEVLSLNLQETDLLVLSACETGLGETRSGEGIQGLRRAFELAGVRTLLCTLWNLDDTASAILMEQFYLNLLDKNMEKLQALTEAKKYTREMTNEQLVCYLRENKHTEQLSNIEISYADRGLSLDELLCDFPEFSEDRPYKQPYYWAGYILQGYVNHL